MRPGADHSDDLRPEDDLVWPSAGTHWQRGGLDADLCHRRSRHGNVTTIVANVDSFLPLTQTFSFSHTKAGYAVSASIKSP